MLFGGGNWFVSQSQDLKNSKVLQICTMVSMHCRSSEGIGGHISRLIKVKRRKDKLILIGAGWNVKSCMWFSGMTDEKGSQVKDVILAWNLNVINMLSRRQHFRIRREANLTSI